ncbi:hypothetical protein J6590_007375 [Homalodisca vitripennis]|nr:hypothetical protein J6590_007375 [Homalodisca vitripennis]
MAKLTCPTPMLVDLPNREVQGGTGYRLQLKVSKVHKKVQKVSHKRRPYSGSLQPEKEVISSFSEVHEVLLKKVANSKQPRRSFRKYRLQ